MPVIVKYKYVQPFMAELAKPEYEGLTDAEVATKLNEPVPTGGKVPVEVSVQAIGQLLFERDRLHVIEDAAVAGNENAKRFVSLLRLQEGGEATIMVNPDSGRVKEVVAGLKLDGLLDGADVTALKELAEEDELGPSLAAGTGIGAVFEENIERLRAYIAWGDETAIREDLAKVLLMRCVRAFLAGPDLTVEVYVQTEAWADRLATIADYTGVTDAARLRELLEELVVAARALQKAGEI